MGLQAVQAHYPRRFCKNPRKGNSLHKMRLTHIQAKIKGKKAESGCGEVIR